MIVQPPRQKPKPNKRPKPIAPIQDIGGGKIEIPILSDQRSENENTPWVNPESASAKPFKLSPAQERYIRRYADRPWIERAKLELYWQCRSCGWKPYPVPVVSRGEPVTLSDGTTVTTDREWEWFSALPFKWRVKLVEDSKRIRSLEIESQRSRRVTLAGTPHGARECQSHLHSANRDYQTPVQAVIVV